MNPKTRQKRIDMGVCIFCGGELDTDGKICTICRKKENERSKLDREFYLSNMICPYCRKEKLFKDERSCPECRAKRTNRVALGREKNRIKYNEKLRKERAIQRKIRKESQICTMCGKKMESIGYAYCEQCLAKRREYKRMRNEKNGVIPRSERVSYGLCYFCGNPIDTNKKVCQICSDRITKNLPEKRGSGNHWKNENKLIFGG